MATLTFDPTMLSGTIRFDGGAFSPPELRAVAGPSQSRTNQLTVNADPDPGDDITLTKVGGASWLTIPATCSHGVPFDVTVDASNLKPGRYDETIRASHDGYDDGNAVVTLFVQPAGPKP
jgi:hypothetical protein